MDRKEKIIEEIQKSQKPVSASALAKKLGVSRQIIVGDVALIRASGTNIIATPRGYILDNHQLQHTYTLAVKHTKEQLSDELYTIVDLGGSIIDVIVEHPIYGQLTGKLHLSSRYDVDQFLQKIQFKIALLSGCVLLIYWFSYLYFYGGIKMKSKFLRTDGLKKYFVK